MPKVTCFYVTMLAVIVAFILLSGAEAALRQPYTTPVIQTSHASVVHPETGGGTVAVLPVSFAVTIANRFARPVQLINGTRPSGSPIIQTHVFTEASLQLVFDVPNPGLDFVMRFTSEDYPVIQDQYGSLWKSVSPLTLEVVKQDTKYTYDVGAVGMTSYQSQSEFLEMPVGTPQYDPECYVTKACCGLNATNYRKYMLVDSPVPAYACTNTSVTYNSVSFQFTTTGAMTFETNSRKTVCAYVASSSAQTTLRCSSNTAIALHEVTLSPTFSIPSPGFLLCRRGLSLLDETYHNSPIPVVASAFCSTRRCIGYSARNYLNDRVVCDGAALGFYTSLDGNNDNQFSYYEGRNITLWPSTFDDLRWIDDMGMSSPSVIQSISFQRDVAESKGWSLNYADFALPLTDTLQPLFPIGRPTRLAARLNTAITPTGIIVEVEYVSFSNFTAAHWTIEACADMRCGSAEFPAAKITNLYPTVMSVTVPLSALGATPQLLPSEVNVTVTCATTPAANPFHTLLVTSTIAVQDAILPSATETIDASLAYKPLQNLPSPYAASLGADSTARIICQGDYRFSPRTNACEPLADHDCKVKYRMRRTYFNTTTGACESHVPKLTGPLVFYPLPDPLPPPPLSTEQIRELMSALQLPQFMQTMEEAFEEHDRIADAQMQSSSRNGLDASVANPVEMRAQIKQATGVSQTPTTLTQHAGTAVFSAATSATSASTPHEMPGFRILSIICIVLICLSWLLILLRDVLFKLCGVSPWPQRSRTAQQLPVSSPPTTASVTPPLTLSPTAQAMTPPTLCHLTPEASTTSSATQPLLGKLRKGDGKAEKKQRAGKAHRVGKKRSPDMLHRARTERLATALPSPPLSAADATSPAAASAKPQRTSSSATSQRHGSAAASNGKSHQHHRTSQERRAPHVHQQTTPVWGKTPSAPFSHQQHHVDPLGEGAEQHTPFGFTSESGKRKQPARRGSHKDRSGSRNGHRADPVYGEYVFEQPLYTDPQDPYQAWRNFPSTPAHTPPTENAAGWRSPGMEDGFAPRSPWYGHYSTEHDPFRSPRSASSAQSRPSPQFSPFDVDAFVPRSPVRQSSRVEVLSSDTEDAQPHREGGTGGAVLRGQYDIRSYHLESID